MKRIIGVLLISIAVLYPVAGQAGVAAGPITGAATTIPSPMAGLIAEPSAFGALLVECIHIFGDELIPMMPAFMQGLCEACVSGCIDGILGAISRGDVMIFLSNMPALCLNIGISTFVGLIVGVIGGAFFPLNLITIMCAALVVPNICCIPCILFIPFWIADIGIVALAGACSGCIYSWISATVVET